MPIRERHDNLEQCFRDKLREMQQARSPKGRGNYSVHGLVTNNGTRAPFQSPGSLHAYYVKSQKHFGRGGRDVHQSKNTGPRCK